MKKLNALLALVAIAGLVFTPVAFADAGTDDLKAEITALKARLAQLEAKVAATPVPAAPAATAPTIEVPSLVQGIQLSGYADATYNYNFNQPNTLTNRARVFDSHANNFNIDVFKLTFQKPVSADNRVGYRGDLLFGTDSQVITSTGLGIGTDEFDLEQGYAEILLPTAGKIPGINDIDLKAGKFVTLMGAEVIESKDNWNTSRGLLFGYAIPFTHTGVRLSQTFDNGWDIAFGVNNGWDITTDTNKGKTLEGHFGFNAIPLPGDSKVTIALNGIVGPEAAGNNHSKRYLSDIVVTYNTPWKPLTLMYNMDYASEEDLLATGINGIWVGHAMYARYDINDKWSVSARGEYFNDQDGVRVLSGTPAKYWEATGTLEYRPWKNLVTRLEYRFDDANRRVFFSNNVGGSLSKDQGTISGEVMYIF